MIEDDVDADQIRVDQRSVQEVADSPIQDVSTALNRV